MSTFDHERYSQIRKVTLVSVAANFTLSCMQLIFGVLGHSAALIADGVHTLSDLITDGVVLFASKHASHAADEDHPYGHARIETVATVVLGVFLFAVAVGIGLDSIDRMLDKDRLLQPGLLALGAAAFGIFLKEMLYQYTHHVGKKVNSRMIIANAWHHRSDAISSIVVFAGVGGSLLGFNYLDAVAAGIVAIFIGRMGWKLTWEALQELVDKALEPEEVEKIERVIKSVDGVHTLHMLRTRRMGADGFIDVHILVDPKVSVSEGHQIGEEVRQALINDIDLVSDVTVHIDPEDDEVKKPCGDLPPREEVLTDLQKVWHARGVSPEFDDIILHYLDGEVHLDLLLPLSKVDNVAEAKDLSEKVVQASRDLQYVGDVRVLYH